MVGNAVATMVWSSAARSSTRPSARKTTAIFRRDPDSAPIVVGAVSACAIVGQVKTEVPQVQLQEQHAAVHAQILLSLRLDFWELLRRRESRPQLHAHIKPEQVTSRGGRRPVGTPFQGSATRMAASV